MAEPGPPREGREALWRLAELAKSLVEERDEIQRLADHDIAIRDERINRLAAGLDCPWCDKPYYVDDARTIIAELRAERDRLREALATLVAWHPATEIGLNGLHPQHRDAVVHAQDALRLPEGQKPA